MKKYQHQKDLNGCGIACLANLLNQNYDKVKKEFEQEFYKVVKYTFVKDLRKFLENRGLKYESKFFNQNKKYIYNKIEGDKYSKIPGSITLIFKNEKYPTGHYLLRVKDGWVDPWFDLPSIDKVKAGVRKELPNNAWYVLYPKSYNPDKSFNPGSKDKKKS